MRSEMMKHQVGNAHEALAYITDCTLATVADRAGTKSAGKRETERQISIAQTSIDWMRAFGVDFSWTRAEEVVRLYDGKVSAWAATFKP